MDIKLSNQNLITYARTDDAIKAFENSANSGQFRLALEVLVEVINGLILEVDNLNEKLNNISPNDKVKSESDNTEKTKPKAVKSASEVKDSNIEV